MLILAYCEKYWANNDLYIISFRNEQGLLHRNDGPAIIDFDSRWWYQNGKLHREDGPAIEYVKYQECYNRYFLNHKELTKEEFENWRIMKTLQESIKEELKS